MADKSFQSDSEEASQNLISDLISQDSPALKESILKAFEAFNQQSSELTKAYQSLKREVARVNMELEEKNRELEKTTLFLNNLFESIPSGLLVVDSSDKVIKCNQVISQMFTLTEEEILQHSLKENEKLSHIQRFVHSLRKSKKERSHAILRVDQEDDQDPMTLQVTGQVLHRISSSEILVVVQDLTEVEYLRHQLVQNESLAGLGRMAVTVAHEIRNPLGGIEGFASLLKRDLSSHEAHSRLLEKIISGVQSLNKFITSLLSFSKPIQVELKECHLNEVLDRVLMYGGKHEEYDNYPKISLEKIWPLTCSPIHSDPSLLQQIFLNLLLNSLQCFDNEGKVLIEGEWVEEIKERENPYLKEVKSINFDGRRPHFVVKISDSGGGIQEEVLPKLFKPFYSTKNFGTGIGLAMVQKMVEVLEGKIQVENHLELGGASFTVAIPDLGQDRSQILIKKGWR